MKPEKVVWEELGVFDASLYKVVYDPVSEGGTSLGVCVPVVTVNHDGIKEVINEVIAEWEGK